MIPHICLQTNVAGTNILSIRSKMLLLQNSLAKSLSIYYNPLQFYLYDLEYELLSAIYIIAQRFLIIII